MLFITCFPSRFMRFGTSGYIMETAAAAAAIPSAMPVAKPNTFISVTFSFRKSLLSRDFPQRFGNAFRRFYSARKSG